ncbi:MAG: hypothetical protein HY721_16700 [Planctomycetes bacterium]|nr:hypothetical protein [Planctomycetota bacterium]
MTRYLVVGAVLILGVAFTIERRAAATCTSSCGVGGNAPCASSCTCWSASGLSIDATYSGSAVCKARFLAVWSCTGGAAAKLTNSADGNPVAICSGQACTGTSWSGNGDITAPSGDCNVTSFIVRIELLQACGMCTGDNEDMRYQDVICTQL